MKLKHTLRAAGAAVLAAALLLSFAVSSSATLDKIFAAGEASALTEELGEGAYTIIFDDLNTCVFKLWGFALWDFSVNKGPIKEILVAEEAGDAVTLEAGANTLKHLAITVDDEKKTVTIGTVETLLWYFTNEEITVKIGVPVKDIRFSTAGKARIQYDDCSLTDFSITTGGAVESYVTFLQNMNTINANIANRGSATFSGDALYVNELNLTASGLSNIYAFEAHTPLAILNLTGSSKAQVYMQYDEEARQAGVIRGTASGGGEVIYDYTRYASDDPAHETLLPKPNYKGLNIAAQGRVTEWFVRP